MIGFGVGGILMGRARRPLRRHGAGADRRASASAPASSLAGMSRQHPAVRARARPADRPARQLGDLRAAGRRHLALVRRRRGIAVAICRERQLPRRRRLAADRCSTSSRPSAGARPTSASASSASSRCCRSRSCCAGGRRALRRDRGAAHAVPDAPRPLGLSPNALQALLVHRRRRLLRRDVDAAGAHRRLLRRPRLRRGARRARCCR